MSGTTVKKEIKKNGAKGKAVEHEETLFDKIDKHIDKL